MGHKDYWPVQSGGKSGDCVNWLNQHLEEPLGPGRGARAMLRHPWVPLPVVNYTTGEGHVIEHPKHQGLAAIGSGGEIRQPG